MVETQFSKRIKASRCNNALEYTLGLAILTRPDNPTRTRHEINGFGSALNGSTRL
jgi:hypothetical protein